MEAFMFGVNEALIPLTYLSKGKKDLLPIKISHQVTALTEHPTIPVSQSCHKQTTDETMTIINTVLMGHGASQLFFQLQ